MASSEHGDADGAPTTPLVDVAPTLGDAETAATGFASVTSSLRYVVREAGLVRGVRTLLRLNQTSGFDCPSCAWPDPEDRSFAEFCENGARAVGDEATTKRVDPAFFARHTVDDLLARSDHWLNDQGRLTHPMVLRPGANHYTPIGWDETFSMLGEALRSLGSPDRAVFYTSGRTSNEAAFLYQLFVRQLGTNNLPDCSNLCHESSGNGLGATLGTGKGSVSLASLVKAGAIFVVGQNPGTNHPRMLSALEAAKRNGAKIVAVNPLEEVGLVRFKHPQKLRGLLGRGTAIADLYLRVRVGGDVALFKGIMKAMLALERATPGSVFDHAFIEAHTTGFDALVADLDGHDWPRLERSSGVARGEMERAAAIAGEADGVVCCWAMGITQHENGVANVQTLVDFLLLGGNVGRPGAGPLPVRGHSNVQGDRTMGIWEKPPRWNDRLGDEFGFVPPKAVGFDVIAAIEAMRDGRAEVFFALGGNFVSATPDTEVTAAALRRCRLTAHVSTKLNRSHLVTGETALILPCLGRTERDVTSRGPMFVSVENSMGVVHASEGRLPPASPHLLSEPRIVARLAATTLGERSSVRWAALADDYDLIRDHIARVVPDHEDYNERVRRPGGFELPNPSFERRFPTDDGKAHFTVHAIPDWDLPEGRFLMTTIRAHDQFNTAVYALDDRYRGVRGGRRVVFVHPEDAGALGLGAGDLVTLTSHYEGRERTARGFAVVPYDVPRGNVATYFPEANALVPLEAFASDSRTPASKSVVVSLTPDAGSGVSASFETTRSSGRGAVILAGGASKRMGRDKAWLEIDGEPLLARVVRVVSAECAPVWVVAAPGRELPALLDDARLVVDPPDRAGEGPLPAVLTGLEQLDREGIATAYLGAVDTPRLDGRLVRVLLERLDAYAADAVCPVEGEGMALGMSLGRRGLAAALRVGPAKRHAAQLVAAGERRLGRLFTAPLRVHEVHASDLPAPEGLEPCNTPEEWARLR